jgi:drug/metabolite transporter (DMT)-like permease
MQFMLLGVGALVTGAIVLARYKSWSRRAAEQMKANEFAEWFRFSYSEEYFQGLYVFGGILLILSGIVFLVKVVGAEPGSTLYRIEGYIIGALVVTAFGGGLAFIIYSNRRFRIKRK